MATEIRFYHLQRMTLDQALPQILSKAYEKGHRIFLRVSDDKEAQRLNAWLWTYQDESFLPHGIKKDGNETDQPILIASDDENKNNADVLVMTNGQVPDNMTEYALCCDIFDGANDEELTAARKRWKEWKELDDVKLSYFQQTDQGGWEKKA